jgi:hypothetical protein
MTRIFFIEVLQTHSWSVVLLYQPRMMYDGDDNDDGCESVGGMIDKGNRITRKNLTQCSFVHHKSHMTRYGL